MKHKRLKREERLFFTEQLSLLLSAGVSLVPALTLLIDSAKRRSLRDFLVVLKGEVESGVPISSVLIQFKNTFSPLYVALVAVGEVSGKLPVIFEYLGEIERNRLEALKSIRKALIYPAMVIVVALGVLVFILTTVVPTFEALYQSGGVELPVITQKVLALSKFLLSRDSMLWGIYVAVGCWVCREVFRRWGKVRIWVDQKLLRLPFVGSLFIASFNASFTQIVGVMIGAGIPLVKGIYLYEEGVLNLYIKQRLQLLRLSLERGDSFYESAQKSEIFSNVTLTFISVGEVSGSLVLVLERAGKYHADIVKQRVEAFIALVDPLSLVLIGGIVGIILVALYLPMFNMGMAI